VTRRRAALAAWAAAIAAACARAPDPGEVAPLRLPDRDAFVDGGVSDFMARRCGALDCHGDVARPMRLYGKEGLRLAIVDAARDDRPTTRDERIANYRSVVGLEPEEISKSVETGGDYVGFMLFDKPLSIEGGGVRHKGGPVLRASDSDPGWVCLRSWVEGKVDPQSCRDATF
jgi:hypothetical protein